MSAASDRPLIVFTDLDGTLLDHGTYDWRPAEPALAALREQSVPLILASSKTAAEMAPLRAELGFAHCPSIVENGAGILPADGTQQGAGDTRYSALRAALDRVPADLRRHFSGFGDMGVAGIMDATGLPEDAARLAADRRFSEPGLWAGTDEDMARFTDALAALGGQARSGGRFVTLSFGGTKAGRMAEITDALFDGVQPFTVALGDAPNDTEMLLAADRAFIVANPHGTPLPPLAGEDDGTITRTAEPGPAGWNAAVLSVLDAWASP
ncbi:MAG: HAD-IIB family hydrolase [Phyllobacteriaceae bacterium]|jgi:mannosyl-3-phosphoglycerate phosphatase|nr:HAD-IIB family hydrolase [Phyllobacteriaceae bacterium]